jgi:hypothetical protein
VIVGSNNLQVTYRPGPPLTPEALAALSPHAVAARIRATSHDDAVDLFASTPTEMLSKKLKALLLADEAKVIAILADLDADRVIELVRPYAKEFPWLADLPRAADAIAQRAVIRQLEHDQGVGRLKRAATSPQGTNGYFREYGPGRIYCHHHGNTSLTCEVSEPIAEFYSASGGTGGELGFPMWGAGLRGPHPVGSGGIWQAFEGGYVAASVHGTYRVSSDVAAVLSAGCPVSSAAERGGVEVQRFEKGTIYSSGAGLILVRPEVAELVNGSWIPTGKEEETGSYRVQPFSNSRGFKSAVYSSDGTGAVLLDGGTLALYKELGGPGGWLGLPIAEATGNDSGGYIQPFEHGSVYEGLRPSFDYILLAVSAATVDLVGDTLGWPTSAEETIGGDDDHRIQHFERGVVTLQHGKRQAWHPA